ncbi:hypothetical protein ACRRTK_009845 [Alexandromys fortis]
MNIVYFDHTHPLIDRFYPLLTPSGCLLPPQLPSYFPILLNDQLSLIKVICRSVVCRASHKSAGNLAVAVPLKKRCPFSQQPIIVNSSSARGGALRPLFHQCQVFLEQAVSVKNDASL